MIAVGKYGKKYVLSRTPEKNDYDGVIYAAPKVGSRVKVKIYNPGCRNAEEENRVFAAVNGQASIPGCTSPIEAVYQNGRFVGYAFVDEEYTDYATPQPPTSVSSTSEHPVIGAFVFGAIASLVLWLFLFNLLARLVPTSAAQLNNHGIPMILMGWLGLFVGLLVANSQLWDSIMLGGILGYVVGALGTFILITLTSIVISFFTAAIPVVAEVAVPIFEMVIVGAIVIYILKSML